MDKPIYPMGFYGTNGCGCLIWCSNDGQRLAIAQYENNDQAITEADALNERMALPVFPQHKSKYLTLDR